MEARIKLNKKPSINDNPKFDVTLLLGGLFRQLQEDMNFSIRLHQPQLVRIVKLLEYIGYYGDFQKGAIEAQRKKKIDFHTASVYVDLYIQWNQFQLQQRDDQGFSEPIFKNVQDLIKIKETEDKMRVIEEQYPAEKIIVLRKFAIKIMENQKEQRYHTNELEKKIQDKKNQISRWGGLFTSKEEERQNKLEIEQLRRQLDTDIKERFPNQRTEFNFELSKLTEDLGHDLVTLQDDEFEALIDMTDNSISLKFSLVIPMFRLVLLNEFDQALVELNIIGQETSIEVSTKYLEINFSMFYLLCRDLWTGVKEIQNIVETRDIENEGEVEPTEEEENEEQRDLEKQSLKIQVVISQVLNNPPPISIKVQSERTLFIIANFHCIKEIQRTMASALAIEEFDIQYYEEQATEKAIELINEGKQILESIKLGSYKPTAVDLNVFISAPVILVPEDIFDIKKPCLIIDIGYISLQSFLVKIEDIQNMQSFKQVNQASKLYDRYIGSFSEFQVSLLEKGIQFGIESIERGCGAQVIKKLNMNLEIFNCIEPMHPIYPTIEMVFIIKTFEIQLDLITLQQILRIQNSLVSQFEDQKEQIFSQIQEPILSDRKQSIRQYRGSLVASGTISEEDELLWERIREEKRKRVSREKTLVKEKALPLSQITEQDLQPPEKIEEIKNLQEKYEYETMTMKLQENAINALQGQTTSFKVYFTVEKLSINVFQQVIKIKESILNINLRHFGVEVELDRHANTHIAICTQELSITDIHKKSQIAAPFRVSLTTFQFTKHLPTISFLLITFVSNQSILASKQEEASHFEDSKDFSGQKERSFFRGVLRKSLIKIISDEQKRTQEMRHQNYSALGFGDNITNQNVLELQIDLDVHRNESLIKCILSDITIIVALPTIQKLIEIQTAFDSVINDLELEQLKLKKAKLQLYEFILIRLCRRGQLGSEEQDLIYRIFQNHIRSRGLNIVVHEKSIKDNIERLKNIWKMRESKQQPNSEKPQIQEQNSNKRRNSSKTASFFNALTKEMQSEKNQHQSQQIATSVIRSKLKIQGILHSLSVLIPLYPESVSTQVLSLSLMQEFALNKTSKVQQSIDSITKEVIIQQELESRDEMSFSINQLKVEMLQSEDFSKIQLRQKIKRQTVMRHRKSSITDESSLSSDSEDLMRGRSTLNINTILSPCRIGAVLQKELINISKNDETSNMNISVNLEPVTVQIGFSDIDFINIILVQLGNIFENNDSLSNKDLQISKLKEESKQREMQIIENPCGPIEKKRKFTKYDPIQNKVASDTLQIKLSCEQLTVSLNDDANGHSQPQIYVNIKYIEADLHQYNQADDAGTFILKKLGVWQLNHPVEAQQKQYLDVNIHIALAANYYNPRSLAYEPLLEKWEFELFAHQLASYTQLNVRFQSDQLLNINITYGMALILRGIKDRMEESLKKAEVVKKIEEGIALNTEVVEMNIDWREKSDQSKVLQKSEQALLQGKEPGFIFQNFLGRDIKIALHDEFSDENLESTLLNTEFDQKRKSTLKRIGPGLLQHQQRIFSLERHNASLLKKTYHELNQLQAETNRFRSGGLFVESLEEDPIRLDFKIRGLQKLAAVPIEGLGIFSYRVQTAKTLNNELQHQMKKSALFKHEAKEKSLGIIFNIQMEGSEKKVRIESNVIIANNTHFRTTFFVKSVLQNESDILEDQIADLKPKSSFQVPISWLLNDTKVSLYAKTGATSQLLLKNIAKRFTYKFEKSKLNNANSKVIQFGKEVFLSIDYFVYSCFPKSAANNPPQYVIAINYPLTVSNYNFHSLQINQPTALENRVIAQMGPKETASLSILNTNDIYSHLQWTIFESQDKLYQLEMSGLNLQQRLHDHESIEKFKLLNRSRIMKSEKRKIKLKFETRKQHSVLHGQENFENRQCIAEYSSSYQMMIFAQYMLVNQTNIPIIFEKQILSPLSNDYLNCINGRAQFKVPGYKFSDTLQINTLGLSGILVMDLENKHEIPKEKFQHSEYIPKRLELGLTISSASKPFNKTLLVNIMPRYVIQNQLSCPVVIKQKGHQSQQLIQNGKAIHYFFENRKDRLLMVREPSKDEIIGASLGNPLYSDLATDSYKVWSPAFSLDEVDDFQIASQKSGGSQMLFKDQEKQPWYEASVENDYQRFVRVIISTENEATILIIFADPVFPEYSIVNKTNEAIMFGQILEESILTTLSKLQINPKLEDLLVNNEFKVLKPQSTMPFAWLNRATAKRLFGLKLGNSIQEINMEKGLKKTTIHSEDGKVNYTVEVRVFGNSKQLTISDPAEIVEPTDKVNQGLFFQKLMRRRQYTKSNFELKLKGIGLSIIDETPQELLFLCLYDLRVHYQKWLEAREDGSGVVEENSKIKLALAHLQLDNMINQTMPVVLAPSKPMKARKKKNIFTNNTAASEKHSSAEHLREESKNDQSVASSSNFAADIPTQEFNQHDDSAPFIQLIISFAEIPQQEETNSQLRLKTLQFAMQEFLFQCDTSIINSNLKFVIEIINTFTDDSDLRVIDANSESFEKAKMQPRESICEDLKANDGLAIENIRTMDKIKANKMYIEMIHLGAIKAVITFKLEKRAVEFDVADPAKAFGIVNLFYTLVAAVASISQSPITLKELILIDSFTTADQLVDMLSLNYMRQGIMQFYKLLGSSDIIGNPVGLINRLGTGVYEFVSEPSKGLLHGPDEFVGGVGRGVQSLVSNVISGSFESMSKITGSLYTVVKNVSGEKNVQIRKTEHIGEGIYYGVKGGVKELVFGVTGIITKPIQKTREEGAKGFFKGLGSGFVGAITAPVTATLRAGTALSQGVAASANSFGKLGRVVMDPNSVYSRFRPPRYINARNVITEYDENLALVRQILKSKYLGKYGGESIKYFCLFPLTKKSGVIQNSDPSSSIAIITETMLLYFKLETQDKKKGRPHRLFKTRLRKIQSCELYKVNVLKGKRRSQSSIQVYHMVISCFSQVKGQKRFTFVSQDYLSLERIYKLLSVLPFCEAVNRVKKLRNSKILGLLEHNNL